MAGLRSTWLDGILWLLPPAACVGAGLLVSGAAVLAVQALFRVGHTHFVEWTGLTAALWVPWWAGRDWRAGARPPAR